MRLVHFDINSSQKSTFLADGWKCQDCVFSVMNTVRLRIQSRNSKTPTTELQKPKQSSEA